MNELETLPGTQVPPTQAPPPEPPPLPPVHIPAHLLNLLRLFPKHGAGRELLRQWFQISEPVPPELDTVQGIVDWLTPIVRRKARSVPFNYTVILRRVAYGNCAWSGAERAETVEEMSQDLLVHILEESPNLDALLDRIAAIAHDRDIGDYDPDWDSCGDGYDYSEHDTTGSESESISISRVNVNANLRVWVTDNYPQLLEKFWRRT